MAPRADEGLRREETASRAPGDGALSQVVRKCAGLRNHSRGPDNTGRTDIVRRGIRVGSYGKFAAFKAEVINAFVAIRGVQSVVEFCRDDGNQLTLARYSTYAGYDGSETAVRQCRRLFVD